MSAPEACQGRVLGPSSCRPRAWEPLGVDLDVGLLISKKMTTPSRPSVRWTTRGWVHGPGLPRRVSRRRTGTETVTPGGCQIRLLFESPSDAPAEMERRAEALAGWTIAGAVVAVTAMTWPLGPEGHPASARILLGRGCAVGECAEGWS